MRWHTRITSSTSCSTSRMPRPSAVRSSRSEANASVSSSLRPEDGSSSSSNVGSPASARPTSTSRARPVGSTSTRSSATGRRPDLVEDLLGPDVGGGASRRSRAARVGPVHLGGDPDVVARRHRAEQLQPLEGAGDAHPGPLRRLHPGDVDAVEQDPASVDPLQAAHGIEQRGLAGSVRTDQPRRRAAGHVEVDAVERGDPAEAHREPLDVQPGDVRRATSDLAMRQTVERVLVDAPTGGWSASDGVHRQPWCGVADVPPDARDLHRPPARAGDELDRRHHRRHRPADHRRRHRRLLAVDLGGERLCAGHGRLDAPLREARRPLRPATRAAWSRSASSSSGRWPAGWRRRWTSCWRLGSSRASAAAVSAPSRWRRSRTSSRLDSSDAGSATRA